MTSRTDNILKVTDVNFNNLFYGILIVTFTYLVMCPDVHKFGEDIKHYCFPNVSVEKLEKNYKKECKVNFSKYLYNPQHSFSDQPHIIEEVPIFSSTHSRLNLAIISTIKLIL